MAEQAKSTFKVVRFDPDQDREPHFDTFEVPQREGLTVLEALFDILENQDGSLAFRYACRGAVCGSCAMYINGAYRLACQTQVAAFSSGKLTVGPMPHFPVIKDLAVDMTEFFRKYERIMPFLVAQSTPPERERVQTPKARATINEMVDCILCGCCYSSCPTVWTDKAYLGPAALTKAYRFLADSRDEAAGERLSIVAGGDGIWRCHTIFNCAEACPKRINPTWSIQQLKKKSALRSLSSWLISGSP
jgi:succinate dehydrogenase / fumarate reductase iron-sulfur subunit